MNISLIKDSKLADAAHAIGQVEVFGEVKKPSIRPKARFSTTENSRIGKAPGAPTNRKQATTSPPRFERARKVTGLSLRY
jgi:hypothetical protein